VRCAAQPSLFGEPEEATDRLILVLYPENAAVLSIDEERRLLMQRHGLSGRLVRADLLHMTMIHIGDFIGLPRGVLSAATEAMTAVRAQAFDVVLDRTLSFLGQPGVLPFVLLAEPAEPLMAFQKALCAALAKAGVRHKSGAQFTPHVTLLRDRISVTEQPIEPTRWTAREFVLAHSLLGRAQHIPLGRWSLG
jgi:2'-5' RNA ligase